MENTENEILKTIGDKLERLRLNKNYEKDKVSEITGINIDTLNQIEQGTSNFSVKTLIKLLSEYSRLNDFIGVITLPKNFDIKKYLKAKKEFEKRLKKQK